MAKIKGPSGGVGEAGRCENGGGGLLGGAHGGAGT